MLSFTELLPSLRNINFTKFKNLYKEKEKIFLVAIICSDTYKPINLNCDIFLQQNKLKLCVNINSMHKKA